MERFITKTWRAISKKDKLRFLFGFLACLICNLYIYTNGLFAHDGIVLYEEGTLTGIQNGRPLALLISAIFNGKYASPWVVGFYFSIAMGFTVVFIAKILHTKHAIWDIVIAGLLVCNYCLYYSQIYVSTLLTYSTAILLTVLGVWFCVKRTWGNIIVGSLLLIAGLCCYQSYICLALVLFVIDIILDLQKADAKIKSTILKGLAYIAIAAGVMIIYYGIWQLGLVITAKNELTYRGYSNITGSISPLNIITSWLIGVTMYFKGYLKGMSLWASILITIASVFVSIIVAYKNKRTKVANFVLTAILVLIALPISSAFIYVLNPGIIPPRMCCGILAPSFLLVASVNNLSLKASKTKEATKWITLLLTIILIIGQFSAANALYLQIDISQKTTYAFASRFMDRLEQIDGFSNKTEVVVVCDEAIVLYDDAEWSDDIAGMGNMTAGASYLPWFIKNNMNTNININFDWEEKYKNNDVIKQLDCFPKKDFYVWIDNVLVVKIPALSSAGMVDNTTDK